MSIPGSLIPLFSTGSSAAVGITTTIERSLRFNSSDSAYLSRTPAVVGNRQKWTWAGWVKRSGLQSGTSNTYMQVFSAGTGSGTRDVFFFDTDTDDTLAFFSASGIASGLMFRTNAVFRDSSAWMHIVLAVNTTIASPSSDRVKLYVNGIEQTFSTVSYPSQNAEGYINLNNSHFIATHPPLSEFFSGYLADIHFIDGQALDATAFTEVSATTGQLIPKAYAGTYTGNSFWLKFNDNSAATATTLGKDSFLLGNNWTPNNVSINTGGPTSVATATGALPILNTSDTYGAVLSSGVRSDSNASSLSIATPLDNLTDQIPTGRTSSAKSISTIGSVTSSGSNSKFYGTTRLWSGSGTNYLLASNSSDYSFGTGDFTIETWYNITTSRPQGTYNIVCSVFSVAGAYGTTGAWHAYVNNSNNSSGMYAENVGDFTVAYTFPLNNWVHVAYVRSGNTLTIYHDGIGQIATTALSGVTFTNPYASGLLIGRLNPTNLGGTTGQHSGYIQDFRIYKGVAKYTGNFNPPTATIIVSVAAANDSLVDTPTSYGTDTYVGGEVRGNYATFNPLSKTSAATLSNGNLDVNHAGNSYPHIAADATIFLPSSGKWYWEISVTTVGEFWTGIRNVIDGKQSTYYRDGSSSFNNIRIEASSSSGSANAASYTSGDVIGVAVNCDGFTIAWYKNGSQVGSTYSLTNVANLVPFSGHASTVGSAIFSTNFGQRAFAYTAPSGFKALCDTNLPEGTITTSGTYTGNGVADGPFVYLNGVPTAMTVGGNAVTFGTDADKLSNGFKLRTTSTTYNQNALSYNYSITTTGAKFKFARAQPNP